MSNYENRHPDDMVLHPLSEIREWDEALAVLGIQDSDQTPADAIRERDAEIERQAARIEQLEAALLPAKNTLNAVRILMKNQDRRSHEQQVYEAVQICCEAMEEVFTPARQENDK